jgi:CheY-like chemotaxis protein
MKNQFLIVDDDALVCRATARMVEHCTGCEAVCCSGGGEALRVFQGGPGAFACVVTDFEMPGMNGLELGDRLRALAPGVKMLLVTGSPGALNGTDVTQHGFDCILAKPFDLAAMDDALRRMLPASNAFSVRRALHALI